MADNTRAHLEACEVNYVLSLPLDRRRDYLDGCERARGKKGADRLRRLVREEWGRRKDANSKA